MMSMLYLKITLVFKSERTKQRKGVNNLHILTRM